MINSTLTWLSLNGDSKFVTYQTIFRVRNVYALFAANRIGDEGAKKLGEVLMTNTSLTEVFFCGDESRHVMLKGEWTKKKGMAIIMDRKQNWR